MTEVSNPPEYARTQLGMREISQIRNYVQKRSLNDQTTILIGTGAIGK
jgi:hypothetical protein